MWGPGEDRDFPGVKLICQFVREVNAHGNGAVAAQLSKLFTVATKFEGETQGAVKNEIAALLSEDTLKSEPREVLARIHGEL